MRMERKVSQLKTRMSESMSQMLVKNPERDDFCSESSLHPERGFPVLDSCLPTGRRMIADHSPRVVHHDFGGPYLAQTCCFTNKSELLSQ